jgi:hypothetical protein
MRLIRIVAPHFVAGLHAGGDAPNIRANRAHRRRGRGIAPASLRGALATGTAFCRSTLQVSARRSYRPGWAGQMNDGGCSVAFVVPGTPIHRNL